MILISHMYHLCLKVDHEDGDGGVASRGANGLDDQVLPH